MCEALSPHAAGEKHKVARFESEYSEYMDSVNATLQKAFKK